jgi:hypothetical protein
MHWIIGKIFKEILRKLADDNVIFTMIKHRIIDYVEEKIMESETKTDDKFLVPILVSLRESKSENLSMDLLGALVDSISNSNGNSIFLFIIDHVEEYVLGSRSKLDDALFLPPLKLLKKLIG